MASDLGTSAIAAPAFGARGPGRALRPAARWRRTIPMVSAIGSVGLTAIMSLLWNGEIRLDMIVTGLVCGIVIERVVGRITRHYRRRLAEANADLERRVLERTADLAAANASLHVAAAEQAALRDELLVRDRLATTGMLAAGVSHEIGTPLQVIGIGIEELEEYLGGHPSPDVLAVIADLRAAAGQISVVAHDLSSLARPAQETQMPVALAPVVARAARLARYQLGRGVTITHDGVAEPVVIGSDSRLLQVVLNLLTNASRATRPGCANTITVSAEERGDTVVLTITDAGSGMSPETQARLFQPFFTTGRDRGGTGLGLTICRSILERLGGTIAVRSTLGVGTSIEVTLRRAAR